jgi:cytochrome c peroxidase
MKYLGFALLTLMIMSARCSNSRTAVIFTNDEIQKIFEHSPLNNLPTNSTNAVADNELAVQLGRSLFFDTRLSRNAKISCASCHNPKEAWTNRKQVSEGASIGKRRTPSLWNVAYNRWYFWDGRSDSLWSQALKPMESFAELDGDRLAIAHVVFDDKELKGQYEKLFTAMPDLNNRRRFPMHATPLALAKRDVEKVAWISMRDEDQEAVNRIFSNIGKAIEAFERTLVTRRAPFDIFVEGLKTGDYQKTNALSQSAQRGLKLFIGKGQCRLCHSGPNFTDSEFHDIGVASSNEEYQNDPARYAGVGEVLSDPFNAIGPYSDDRSGDNAAKIVHLKNQPHFFGQYKTPSLRNVALVYPYMHQGQFEDLHRVMQFYSTLEGATRVDHHKEQLIKPLLLTDQEIADLISFLQSLTDIGLIETATL